MQRNWRNSRKESKTESEANVARKMGTINCSLEEKEQRIRDLQRQLHSRTPLSTPSGSATASPHTPVRRTAEVTVDGTPTSVRSMMSRSVDIRQPGP